MWGWEMYLFIDGDGCPVVDCCLRAAQLYDVKVVLVCDSAHFYQLENTEVIIVDQDRDLSDFESLKRIKWIDLMVNHYTGLAALAMDKVAICIHPGGRIYEEGHLLALLNQRSDGMKARRSKHHRFHCGHQSKYTEQERECFYAQLCQLLKKAGKGEEHGADGV